MASIGSKTTKYLTHGAVSAIIFQKIVNPTESGMRLSLLGGKSVPVWMASAAMGIGASALADIIADYILPQLQSDKKLAKMEGSLVTVGSGAAGYVAMGYLANPALINTDGQLKQLAMTGAISELVSQFVYENFVAVYMQ